MKPDISEFSFGFALTNELIRSPGFSVRAAPVFPSLIQEGRMGGGWDVRLDRPGLPLFLQFKLSDYLKNRSAREASTLGCPYYRMHIRPARHSKQHEMLLSLEQLRQDVYYVAPAFHTVQELNAAYQADQVGAKSLWLRPSEIGALPDSNDHYVAFRVPGNRVFRSEPRLLGEGSTHQDLMQALSRDMATRGQTAMSVRAIQTLAAEIRTIVKSSLPLRSGDAVFLDDLLVEASALEQIAYFSSVFLEAQFFLVTPTAV